MEIRVTKEKPIESTAQIPILMLAVITYDTPTLIWVRMLILHIIQKYTKNNIKQPKTPKK